MVFFLLVCCRPVRKCLWDFRKTELKSAKEIGGNECFSRYPNCCRAGSRWRLRMTTRWMTAEDAFSSRQAAITQRMTRPLLDSARGSSRWPGRRLSDLPGKNQSRCLSTRRLTTLSFHSARGMGKWQLLNDGGIFTKGRYITYCPL